MDRTVKDPAYRMEQARRAQIEARLKLWFLEQPHPFLKRWILAQVLGPPVAFRASGRARVRAGTPAPARSGSTAAGGPHEHRKEKK